MLNGVVIGGSACFIGRSYWRWRCCCKRGNGVPMRRLIGWVLTGGAVVLLGSSSPVRDNPDLSTRPIALRFTPIALDGLQVTSRLRAIGAWHVTSSRTGFGGISAMAIQNRHMILVSDTGVIIDVVPDFANRRAVGSMSGVATDCGYDGQKASRDSESLAIDPATGVRWIGFESRNVICRIAPQQSGSARYVAPVALRRWPKTGGPEAMTRLRDGRFVAIAERPRGGGRDSPVAVFDRDPLDPGASAKARLFQPPRRHRPTDLVELPDGGWLALTRSYRPPFAFDGRLILIDRNSQDAFRMSGKTIGWFAAPLDENFEALAVTQSQGRTYVWAMTDDNFMPFQRTILVLMELGS